MASRLSALLPRPSSSGLPATSRHFGSSPASLLPKGPTTRMSTSTRKFVEALRREDPYDGYASERAGQSSRAFSPKLGKPFANLDRWPPPGNYVGKGHKKPAMTQTSLLQKPRLREVSREADLEPGWTRVLPPGEGQSLADTLRAKGFKKVKHYNGGVKGGVPPWILRKEQARLEAEERGEVPQERDIRNARGAAGPSTRSPNSSGSRGGR